MAIYNFPFKLYRTIVQELKILEVRCKRAYTPLPLLLSGSSFGVTAFRGTNFHGKIVAFDAASFTALGVCISLPVSQRSSWAMHKEYH